MQEPRAVTPELLRSLPLPQPEAESGKDARGRVLLIAGSREVPGAALLAATAALRSGAGRVRVATCESAAGGLGLAMPEARVIALPETPAGDVSPDALDALQGHLAHTDTVAVGPGLLDTRDAGRIVEGVLREAPTAALLIDAAALPSLGGQREALRARKLTPVLTPHAGEMAKLSGEDRDAVEAEPLDCARRVASDLSSVVVLKGRQTNIAAPNGEAWLHRGGNVGLATSGSGDVLAGIICGLLARGAAPERAAIWGVYLHGRAAERLAAKRGGPLGFLARELLEEVPGLMAELAPRSED
jgi:ADP-dependent NAD(P)H-hydrate dehydratase